MGDYLLTIKFNRACNAMPGCAWIDWIDMCGSTSRVREKVDYRNDTAFKNNGNYGL